MVKLDFTLRLLEELYSNLLKHNYKIITFSRFLEERKENRCCILRHDVDKDLKNALLIARKEQGLGIRAAYYFRYKKTFSEEIINKIHNLGHEVGYHYETLAKANGDYAKAIDLFKKELEEFRKIVPVKTISPHGSPLSGWDNRRLWDKYDFRDFGITGEASVSINFDQILYLTDTGRCWNKDIGNIRDKVATNFDRRFCSTFEIIDAINRNELPDKIMLSIHPGRWSSNLLGWAAELVNQNIKNVIKETIIHK